MKTTVSILISALFAIPATAGTFSVVTGRGQEIIETTSEDIKADLYQVAGNYRASNGVMFGASAMLGYPDNNNVPDEGRYELSLGYGSKIRRFAPYGTVSLGKRTRENRSTIQYHTMTIGTKYAMTDKVFTDISYRFRDTNDMQWKTNTYSVGVGYNVTQSFAVQGMYGKTTGDYTSDLYSIFFVNRW